MEDFGSTTRNNIMHQKDYTPYCGSEFCSPRTPSSPERWPRTNFNGEQFVCPKCGWKSSYEKEFIKNYKEKWKLK